MNLAWAFAMAICAMLYCAQSLADIDNSAYEAAGAVRDKGEQQRLKQQLERDIETERQRAAADAERTETARQEALARKMSQSYPERLTEQHCTSCHTADNFTTKGHTWLMWRLIVARMAWLNDAPVPFEAQNIVADYLMRAYPVAPENEITEFAYILAALLPILMVPWAFFLLLGRASDRSSWITNQPNA
jgi:hypothetical protein